MFPNPIVHVPRHARACKPCGVTGHAYGDHDCKAVATLPRSRRRDGYNVGRGPGAGATSSGPTAPREVVRGGMVLL